MSILAIEESSKLALLLMVFLVGGDERIKLWRSYRTHRAKTAWLNPAIESRIRATFPQISREDASKLAEAGPGPEELESTKQHAIYSDCFEQSGTFIAHCPSLAEWRQTAWERLCEAQAMVTGMRDFPPEELTIWKEHISRAAQEGRSALSALPALHEELLNRKLIKDGWWKTLLQDADFELHRRE
jgi:AbiV family abortive infection protein